MFDVGRREFIALVGGVAAWPLAARAQQPAKVARIGYLDLGPASARESRVEVLRAGLRDLGWVEGKNTLIEFRWADNVSQLPALAAELVRMNVDVIFAPSSTMVEPASKATKTIPIVFSNHADPIGTGQCGNSSAAGRQHHRPLRAGHRAQRQGIRNAEGGCANGNADWRALESNDALAGSWLAGRQSCGRETRPRAARCASDNVGTVRSCLGVHGAGSC
jgi:hypothetical protein